MRYDDPRVFVRLLAFGLTVAALAWAAALLGSPRRSFREAFPVLTVIVQVTGRSICHQRPDRSFHADARALPVCARCTGLYASGALGSLAAWWGLAALPRRTRLLLAAAAAPTALSIAIEWSGVAPVSNMMRAAAALPLGAVAGWIPVRLLRAESGPTACAMIC